MAFILPSFALRARKGERRDGIKKECVASECMLIAKPNVFEPYGKKNNKVDTSNIRAPSYLAWREGIGPSETPRDLIITESVQRGMLVERGA